jgi:signal transduction histidine kinase
MPHAEHPAEPSPAGRNSPRQPKAASHEELQQRRRGIDRGLRRSHYAIIAASLVVGLFALAALWLSGEARHRADDARLAQQRAQLLAAEVVRASTNLSETAFRAARLQRSVRSAGQRTRTLELVGEAARLQPSRELRDEAQSALLLPDVGTNLVWREEPGFEIAMAYDQSLEHSIQNNDRGRAIVRMATDGTPLMDEAGFGEGTRFWQFSPDGRLAAIGFSGGEIGVWDWRQSNLVARIPTLDEAGFGESRFAFAPDNQQLWFLTTNHVLATYNLRQGLLTPVLTPSHPARFINLSPSARFAAIASVKEHEVNNLEVWDLASRTHRAGLALTNDIWCLAWQPGEERLAIGCYGGLFVWDVGAASAATLKEGEVAITQLFFNQDGSLLFVGGWNELGEIWDARLLRRVLEPGVGRLVQLSRDQKRIATVQEKVGYGIREFFEPLGVRSWPAPPLLASSRWGADLDPQEHWVLTAHTHGWLLRDAESGKALARIHCDLVGMASFSSDGSNVVAWTSQGLVRWPLDAKSDGMVAVGLARVFGFPMQEGLNTTCSSADRRTMARSFQGAMTVVQTDDPSQQVNIPLRRTRDSSIHLSPDGHWLITGYNNQAGWDLYDAQAGRFVRTIAENELAGAAFHPFTGQLFTCSATGYELRQIPEGTAVKHVTWRIPYLAEGFLGFAPDGRLALVKGSASILQLYDLETGRDFATLDFRDPPAVFKAVWSRDGQRVFLFGNDGGVTRADLAALRRELESLGLNWSDAGPSDEFPLLAVGGREPATLITSGRIGFGHTPAFLDPVRLAWIIWIGLAATIAIGLYVLRNQRRLFAGYLETEALAARRQSELRQTQDALQHSEKMKALGTLSAGIAHDFNNLLSIIRLSNELIEEQVHPQGVTKDNFDAIHHAIQRGRGIVNSMLGYARDDGQPGQFTATELISEAVALLGKSFLGGLVLQVEVAPDTPQLFARKGRVEQMLFNLIVNAAEAMRGQGTITLQARFARESGSCLLLPAPANSFVELGVQDTGPGISPDVLPRIFEPFFTTKTIGSRRGTGLGLSMLYTMAREEGIGVAVSTELGKGTTFRLLLPLAKEPQAGTENPVAGHHSPIEGAPPTLNPHS